MGAAQRRLAYTSRPIPMDRVRLDPETQPRVEIDQALVGEYREELDAGAVFDNVAVYWDGEGYWLADGWHRFLAYRASGRHMIPANVYQGGKREAILHAVGANAEHGLRRTNADKRRAIEILLRDPEWSTWSDTQVAGQCAVTNKTVARVRRELESTQEIPKSTVRMGGDGRATDTTRIGRKPVEAKVWRAAEDLPDFGAPPPAGPGPEASAAPKPAGKSWVNGRLADDPPDVAAARAAGRIAPEVIVEVTEPGPDPGPTDATGPPPGPGPAEPTDEEYLAGLPAREKLSARCREVFDADALAYRQLEPHRKAFHHHASRIARGRGEYAWRVRRFLKTDHPKHWLACPAPEHGGCGGTGEVTLIGQCPKCRGKGYWIQ